MPNDALQELLGSAATEILETMFFLCPEGTVAPEHWDTFHTGASLGFHGERTGGFEILLDRDLAKEMTAGFLGTMDPSEVGPEQVDQVACELANMVCGVTLSRMSPGAIFSLGVPAPGKHGDSDFVGIEERGSEALPAFIEERGSEALPAFIEDPSGLIVRWLDSGQGLIRLALALNPVEEQQ